MPREKLLSGNKSMIQRDAKMILIIIVGRFKYDTFGIIYYGGYSVIILCSRKNPSRRYHGITQVYIVRWDISGTRYQNIIHSVHIIILYSKCSWYQEPPPHKLLMETVSIIVW